jgi:hypothetical protein
LTYFARPESHNLLADSEEVVTSAGVVSTTAAEDSVPEQFFDDQGAHTGEHDRIRS